MRDAPSYDQQVAAIRAYNQPILVGFQDWLERAGRSAATVRTHVQNMELFATYLVYYEPLKRLDEAESGDVWMFLADWFPRKAVWASASSVRAYLASFKQFYRWLGQTGQVTPATVTAVLETLKDERAVFLRAVADV